MKKIVFYLLVLSISVFGYVTVTSPNGGEVITRGGVYEITWNDDLSEDVKIELYRNGEYNYEIIASTPSDGSFTWILDLGLYGSDFQIKISSTVMPVLHTDMSDTLFSIEREIGIINILEHRYLWISAGIGPGSFSSMSGNFGSSFGFGFNYSSNDRIYKVRLARIEEFKIFGDSPPPDSILEAGILYGFCSVTKKSMLSLSLGISFVHSEKNIYVAYNSSYSYMTEKSDGVGIPIEAQAVWFITDGIGANVSLFGDFNKENSFGGLSLGIILGGKM